MAARRPAPRLSSHVELTVTYAKAGSHAAALRRLAHRFLAELDLIAVELSISLVNDRDIRELNRTWRNKDKPTDVLSFPAGDFPEGVPMLRPLGDIVISYDTTLKHAEEYGRTPREELERYLAHGLLHLLGHDHETPKDAARMAKLEDALLGKPGMVRTAEVSLADEGQAFRKVPGLKDRVAATKGKAASAPKLKATRNAVASKRNANAGARSTAATKKTGRGSRATASKKRSHERRA